MFEEFCRTFHIIHVKVAAGTPRRNGQIEHLNKTILACLPASLDCESGDREWDVKLLDLKWSINSTVHCVTKYCIHLLN